MYICMHVCYENISKVTRVHRLVAAGPGVRTIAVFETCGRRRHRRRTRMVFRRRGTYLLRTAARTG